jgi:hypothetical protein
MSCPRTFQADRREPGQYAGRPSRVFRDEADRARRSSRRTDTVGSKQEKTEDDTHHRGKLTEGIRQACAGRATVPVLSQGEAVDATAPAMIRWGLRIAKRSRRESGPL